MLGIPFLSRYIQKIVKEQAVADSADWLNYYCTSILLAFFSLAISAKQYFGSAIKCWTPNEFKGGWEKYAEDYCFIANSYYVPYDEEVPSDLSLRGDHISYYRWVPIMLAMQALLFWLPNWLWNMLHKQTAVNPRALVNEAIRSRESTGVERDKEVENLAAYIADVLTVFHYRKGSRTIPRSGFNATVLYLSIKLLYVLNVVGQLVLLNKFLGGQYFSWGYDQFASLVRGEEWKESEIFPRVIMCDFVVRRLANPQRHTIQCVIMMNMINEKLYFFLYFWLLFVGATTLINFFYYVAALTIPYLRTKFVLYNINRKEQKARGMRSRDLHRFVQVFLRPDGVLLLQFIRQHIGGRVTYDLLNELLRLYWNKECQRHDDDNTTTTKSSPLSDKTPRGNGDNYANNILHRNPHMIGHDQRGDDTYKPTMYGPASLYPKHVQYPYNSHNNNNVEQQDDWAEKRPLSPEDYIDSGPDEADSRANTLPIQEHGYAKPPPMSPNGAHNNNIQPSPLHRPYAPLTPVSARTPMTPAGAQHSTPQVVLTPSSRNGATPSKNVGGTPPRYHFPTPEAHNENEPPKKMSNFQSSV